MSRGLYICLMGDNSSILATQFLRFPEKEFGALCNVNLWTLFGEHMHEKNISFSSPEQLVPIS